MKKSYFINERAKPTYNNGAPIMVGDRIVNNGKPGKIIDVTASGLNLKYDDGTGQHIVDYKGLVKTSMRHLGLIASEFSVRAFEM